MVEEIIWYVAALAAAEGAAAYVYLAAVYLYANSQSNLMRHRARRAAITTSVEGRKEMVRQPITNRRTLYGINRVSGPITFLHVSSAKYLYILITLSGHEVHAIDDVYLNDEKLDIDTDGTVYGRYYGNVVVKKGLGSTGGDSGLHAYLISEVPDKWTVNHLQTGCAKILVRFAPNRDVFFQGIPNITCVVRGKKLYDPRTTLTAYSDNPWLCIRDYLTDTTLGLGSVTAEVDDTIGNASANTCEETVALTAQPNTFTAKRLPTPVITPAAEDSSTGTGELLSGISYRYKITFYDASGETDGSPASTGAAMDVDYRSKIINNIQTGSPTTVGRKIYRSTNDSTVFSLAGTIADNTTTTFTDDGSTTGAEIPSTNTTDITDTFVRDSAVPHIATGDPVVLTTTGTLPSPYALATTYYYIYVDSETGKIATSRANALAGTAITRTNAGSGVHSITRTYESRYTLNGPVDSGDTPKTILEAMLTSCAGKLMNPGGIWTHYVGAFRTPTLTFDEDDLDGPIRVTTRLSKRELANGVKGVYVDPAKDWQPSDFPPITNATYKTEDNEERLWRDVELPFTITPSMAQRLAKIELEKNRQQIATVWPCKLTVLSSQVGDVVNLTNTRFGWSGKDFEIGDLKFVVRSDGDVPRLGVDLTMRETASGVYDWNSGEETLVDLAPNTSLPDPFDIIKPTGLAVESGTNRLLVRSDGTIFSRAYVSWTATTDEYIRSGGRVELQYRKTTSTATDWEKASSIPGTESSAYILDVDDGATYLFRIQYVNNLGVPSGWVSAVHTVIGKTEPPVDVESITVSRLGDGTRQYSWVYPNPPLDLAGFKIRYRSGTGYTWEQMYPLHTGLLTASPFESNLLAAGTYSIGIKAVDTTGNESANAATTEQTLADPRLGGSILEVNPEQDGWPGTKTNCWVDEANRLWISDSLTWDGFASAAYTWEQWTSWAMAPYLTATYDHTEINLGASYTFTPLVSVFGNASFTVEESHSTDGVIYTDYTVTGALITAKYLKLRITLEHP